MNDATTLLKAIDAGDPQAAEQLLPLVYDELRRLAAHRLAQEKPGQTLDATGLVHEAYLRLVRGQPGQPWNGRSHFFAAAAEAMRRILIEKARHKGRIRHGGGVKRVSLEEINVAADPDTAADELLAVNEALDKLAAENAAVANVVKYRYFLGMTIEQTAEVMDLSVRTVNRHWNYARAKLFQHLNPE